MDTAITLKVLIPIAGFLILVFGWLHQLIVKKKEATIEKKNSTIEAQDKEIARLKLLLDEAKNSSPDVLADRYKKKIDRYEADLKELMSEGEANTAAIKEKEIALQTEQANVAELTEQMNRANEILEDYKYYKELFACPHCGAETTGLINNDDNDYTSYACGYTISDGYDSPCPHDPEFPTLDEYELELQERGRKWLCFATPKTRGARKLTLSATRAETRELAEAQMVKQYEYAAKDVPKN